MSRSSRRRQEEYNAQMTPAELTEYRAKLATMEAREVEINYKTLHDMCAYSDMRVCSPMMIQQFVQVWRRLRELKGTRRVWG